MLAIKPIPNRVHLSELRYEYRQRIQPFVDILCDIENVTVHRTLLHLDGRLERIDNYSPENQKLRIELLKAIDDIRSGIESRAEESVIVP